MVCLRGRPGPRAGSGRRDAAGLFAGTTGALRRCPWRRATHASTSLTRYRNTRALNTTGTGASGSASAVFSAVRRRPSSSPICLRVSRALSRACVGFTRGERPASARPVNRKLSRAASSPSTKGPSWRAGGLRSFHSQPFLREVYAKIRVRTHPDQGLCGLTRYLAKVKVAGSRLVIRSDSPRCESAGGSCILPGQRPFLCGCRRQSCTPVPSPPARGFPAQGSFWGELGRRFTRNLRERSDPPARRRGAAVAA